MACATNHLPSALLATDMPAPAQHKRAAPEPGQGPAPKKGKAPRGKGKSKQLLSQAELQELRGGTVSKPGQVTQPVGFTLGYSKSNGGFGSKADTIARDAREGVWLGS